MKKVLLFLFFGGYLAFSIEAQNAMNTVRKPEEAIKKQSRKIDTKEFEGIMVRSSDYLDTVINF